MKVRTTLDITGRADRANNPATHFNQFVVNMTCRDHVCVMGKHFYFSFDQFIDTDNQYSKQGFGVRPSGRLVVVLSRKS